MGYMKDLDIRIRNGGDDAIAAACELADLSKARRGYDDTMRAKEDITDVVTVLRGVGFVSVSPEASDSASLLHRVVMAAADEIEHLRKERRWIPVSERVPEIGEHVLACWVQRKDGMATAVRRELNGKTVWSAADQWNEIDPPIAWMPLPEPPVRY